MALTPTGETGRTIQFKRTRLAYNSEAVVNEHLNYGEPLYNDLDKTLLIGDRDTSSSDNLKVIKAFDRSKANSQVFYTGSGASTLDDTSNIANLFNENDINVYIKDKNWGNFSIATNADTYTFTVDSNNNIVPNSTKMSTSFSTLPCVVKVPVTGMRSNYVPTVSSYLNRNVSTTVSNIKSQQKAFSCIGRCDSADNYLYLVFCKQPAVAFSISVVGG